VRQTPLVHAFNEPIPVCDVLPPVGSPLRLAFCGNVNLSCEDAATRFGQAIAACNDVVVRIYSGTNPDYLRQIGLLPPGVSCEKLSRDEIPSRLSKADILLLPHGFSDPGCAPEEFLTIFPTKTIEYLISGRPILAHSPAESYLTRFLIEHDCALVVDRPDVGALRAAIERLRNDGELRLRLVRNALLAARFFRGPRVAAELRRRLAIKCVHIQEEVK
jgi:glycosyltransferase involved in cell wall biosynthesis